MCMCTRGAGGGVYLASSLQNLQCACARGGGGVYLASSLQNLQCACARGGGGGVYLASSLQNLQCACARGGGGGVPGKLFTKPDAIVYTSKFMLLFLHAERKQR